MRSVVVTGVSSGIGYAIAQELVTHNIKVFGSVRNEKDALRIKNELGTLFVPLIFDITDENAVKKAVHEVREQLQGEKLWGLINNAGVAVVGPLIETPLDEFRHQLEVNVIGQIQVTQAFISLLGAEKTLKGDSGKIVNIGSISGKICRPFFGPYSISKYGVEAFSDTLRIELMTYGIDVVLIRPGMINTSIWHKNEDKVSEDKLGQSIYAKPLLKFKNYIYHKVEQSALPANKMGNLVYKILSNPQPKTSYVLVPNLFSDWILPMLLPKRFLNKKIAKALGFLKKD
ncbi:oxidoreductase with NAD(P)-binding Rossmann-fold domain [Legionella steigerwaltii]|uniref:Oxidoreductase with NAD(P)-binding Rossmann-fold domain n=1 Tax=Legionella steigerwaltii TaxID=460 RepID=A0A378L8A8_9GAMM|nr:SDR family NAD(P)-dependent oxidoreductase [Legionella steigerwaltii]KTD77756.1 oxidoreductase with NAD(P)-binding Rossmann-fold domain protein [Legionella steigerwaltii]STY23066.1 oxidoreductase with NAD(P)-binding Rossmann-fold domain [Legionella steigerwaltii]